MEIWEGKLRLKYQGENLQEKWGLEMLLSVVKQGVAFQIPRFIFFLFVLLSLSSVSPDRLRAQPS
jgi:hypothetical protein